MSVDPTRLSIVHHPDPVLRRKTDPVGSVDEETLAVAQKMIELMIDAPGIGLAAPQVGLPWRMFVCHVPPSEDDEIDPEPVDETAPPQTTDRPMVAINPVLSEPSRDLIPYEEGCLSLPNITGEVRRPEEITMTASDEHGQEYTRRASGLLARCWQHEFDHLEGVLILDRMTPGSRLKNRRAVKELEKGLV